MFSKLAADVSDTSNCGSSGCRSQEQGGVIAEIQVVVLRFRSELRAPGCMHIILEAVSPRAPYLLENRSGQGLRYRQVGITNLPYLPLPPYSATGFSWQRDPSSGGIPSVRPLAEDPCGELSASCTGAFFVGQPITSPMHATCMPHGWVELFGTNSVLYHCSCAIWIGLEYRGEFCGAD